MLFLPLKETLKNQSSIFKSFYYLLIKPGETLRFFLFEDRKSLHHPLNFLLFIGTITTVLSLRYNFFKNEFTSKDAEHIKPIHSGIALFDNQHLFLERFFAYAEDFATIINIISIPIFSFFSYFFFKICKPSTNYGENLVINTFVTAQQLSILLLFVPILEFFPNTRVAVIPAYTVLTAIYNVFVYMKFFQGNGWVLFFKAILSMILAYATQLFLNLIFFYFAEPYVSILDKLNLT